MKLKIWVSVVIFDVLLRLHVLIWNKRPEKLRQEEAFLFIQRT